MGIKCRLTGRTPFPCNAYCMPPMMMPSSGFSFPGAGSLNELQLVAVQIFAQFLRLPALNQERAFIAVGIGTVKRPGAIVIEVEIAQ